MTLREWLASRILVLDGAMGTLLQTMGYDAAPETLNAKVPEVIEGIHRAYFEAGSRVVAANTFGINRLRYGDAVEEMVSQAVALAMRAKDGQSDRFVALDIGPLGRLLRPFGDLDFEEAVAVFAQVVRCGVRCGVDLVLIETMGDLYETKAALLAVKENCDLPVFVSNAYGEDGKLLTGATPQAMVALAEGMGADAIGANCSFGPRQLKGVVDALLQAASIPVLCKPNAGLPTAHGYDVDAAAFVDDVTDMVRRGVRLVGGCCGTTPEYVRHLVSKLPPRPLPIQPKHNTVVCSYTHAVSLDRPILIGERLNPTGKKRLQTALREGEWDYVCEEALRQQTAGAHALDVNVALPELDEETTMVQVLDALAATVDVPLQLDSGSPAVLQAAMRRYNGKALINSVNGKQQVMDAVFPLVARYGGVVVALTLDEEGIPATAEGRVAIARRIVATAARYGLGPWDLVFDPLCLAVSADAQAPTVTLQALDALHRLGYRTVLGLSNVSYGLPGRDTLNATYLAMALAHGLSAAIVNPFSTPLMDAYYAFGALSGLDADCSQYIAKVQPAQAPAPVTADLDLVTAIVCGLKERAGRLAVEQLRTRTPLDLINEDIVPALDEIGRRYEAKTAFLPQLLLAAEAAKSAFGAIKSRDEAPARCCFVLATVQGDIHDIGKNIVGLMLSNYGFRVIDLGKDVPPMRVVEAVQRHRAPLVGLSSLMTTTLPAMRETVALLRQHTDAHVVVGGAVLTAEYAAAIGADCYAKDAMETVRYAERIYNELRRDS